MLEFFKNFQTDRGTERNWHQAGYPQDFITDLANENSPRSRGSAPRSCRPSTPATRRPKLGEFAVREADEEAATITRLLGEDGAVRDLGRERRLLRPRGPAGRPAGYTGRVPDGSDITNNAGGITGPIGLGFRVPLLVLSPFSRGGFLCSDTFDHTSLLRFLEPRFGAEVPNLSEWRREDHRRSDERLQLRRPGQQQRQTPGAERDE